MTGAGRERFPLVSVVVPAYNASKYIGQCIDSLLAQTYRRFEIVVVDDGSTDSTPDVLSGYAGLENVRIVRQENRGVSAARNAGLSLAKGEYVAFVDSDDVVHPELLERCCGLIGEYGCEFVLLTLAEFEDDENPDFKPVSRDGFDMVQDPLRYYLENGFKGGMSSMVVKRSQVEGLKFPVGVSKGEDLCFSYSLLRRLSKGARIREPVYFYRRTQGSLDRTAMTVNDAVAFADIMRSLSRIYADDEKKSKMLKRCLFPRIVKNLVKRAIPAVGPDGAAEIYSRIASLLHEGVVGYSGFTLRWRWRLWRIGLKHGVRQGRC